MFLLLQIESNWRISLEKNENLSGDELFTRLLVGSSDDKQTKPSEHVLTWLKDHPYATSLLTSLLEKPGARVVPENLQEITFENVGSSRDGLISYM